MCGIHGIVALGTALLPPADVLGRMGGVTRHRGPDDEGRFVDPSVLLGMRRLSIIDLAGGHQPIANEDESVRVVCNGEIYNFRELRTALERRGHAFRTRSDTEVIVHLYEEHREDLVRHLDGMYALAVWDAPRRRLVLARDRLGIKPLYYAERPGLLAFASEAKALLEVPGIEAALDPEGLDDYLSFGYVPAPRSIFRGIRKLPVASRMVCEGGQCRIDRYWDVPAPAAERRTEADWIEEVQARLKKAVVSQMVSDVPLGGFLSGGIDSSTIVAFMAAASDAPIRTYSIGFEGTAAEGYYNELPYAGRVSRIFGTEHREIVVKPDVAALLPKLLWHLDEPVADTAFLTTHLVAEFAAREVRVILSGVGGDELFGGYRRYLGPYYDRYLRFVPRWLRRGLLVPLARRLPSDRHSALRNLCRHVRSYLLSQDLPLEERYRSYVRVFRPEVRDALAGSAAARAQDALDRAFAQAGDGDALYRMFRVDAETQLPDDLLLLTDKMTMANSLECRVPLLDHELVETSARMPSDLKIRGRVLKYLLKRALRGVLPEDILHRPKRGFGAPMGSWIRGQLAPLLDRVLSRESLERRGLLRWNVVEETIALHRAGREDHTDHLLALLNLELWSRIYLDRRPQEDVAAELASEAVR